MSQSALSRKSHYVGNEPGTITFSYHLSVHVVSYKSGLLNHMWGGSANLVSVDHYNKHMHTYTLST